MSIMMHNSTDLIEFMLFSQDKTASSTLQVPVWSLGMRIDTKVSRRYLKSKCPLIFEAFKADDKVLNGHGNTEE